MNHTPFGIVRAASRAASRSLPTTPEASLLKSHKQEYYVKMSLTPPTLPPSGRLNSRRTSGVYIFLSVYAAVFALAALLLFTSELGSKHNLNSSQQQHRHPSDSSSTSTDDSWKAGLYTNRTLLRDSDPLRLKYSDMRWTNSMVNCSVISEVKNLEFVAAGWTKAVYRGTFRGRDVAVKTVNLHGQDISECSDKGISIVVCYRRAAAKILRELVLLTELQHQNVVKVLGACIPEWDGALGPVASVTELGETLDSVQLLQLPWEKRLQMAMDMAELLHHLAHSSLGSLVMNEFRRQQFVLVRGTLKLSDVDDLGLTESQTASSTSAPPSPTGHTRNCTASCSHNEERNIHHAGRHFIQALLPYGAPDTLRAQVKEVVDSYTKNVCNTSHILKITKSLYASYSSTVNGYR